MLFAMNQYNLSHYIFSGFKIGSRKIFAISEEGKQRVSRKNLNLTVMMILKSPARSAVLVSLIISRSCLKSRIFAKIYRASFKYQKT